MSKLLLSNSQICWRYTSYTSTPRPSYYKWDIFSTAKLTLNFGLDLSNVNGKIWQKILKRLSRISISWNGTFREIVTNEWNQPTNQRANQHNTFNDSWVRGRGTPAFDWGSAHDVLFIAIRHSPYWKSPTCPFFRSRYAKNYQWWAL